MSNIMTIENLKVGTCTCTCNCKDKQGYFTLAPKRVFFKNTENDDPRKLFSGIVCGHFADCKDGSKCIMSYCLYERDNSEGEGESGDDNGGLNGDISPTKLDFTKE